LEYIAVSKLMKFLSKITQEALNKHGILADAVSSVFDAIESGELETVEIEMNKDEKG